MAPPRKRYAEPLMTREQRAARMEEICRRFESGASPNDIASTYKISANHVRQILRTRGHDILEDKSRVPRPDSVWDMDDAARRKEIIRRSADGARRTLDAMFSG